MRIIGDDAVHVLEIDTSAVKRYTFNGMNGLWTFRMQDGRKLVLQSSGTLLSADRSLAGRQSNVQITMLLREHGARGLGI